MSKYTKVGGVWVIPLHVKIVVVMVLLLLASNVGSNLINLVMNRGEQVKLLNTLLVRDLTELFIFTGNQYEIYANYEKDLSKSAKVLRDNSLHNLKRSRSSSFAVYPDGSLLFFASPDLDWKVFPDSEALAGINQLKLEKVNEGKFNFTDGKYQYKAIYKYQAGWDVFLVRAEDQDVFNEDSMRVFWTIALIILIFTLMVTLVAVLVLRHMFRFVDRITESLMAMQRTQELDLIDLPNAPSDDITYMAMSFNSLSVTVKNLMSIFRRFVTQDVATRAYKDRTIRLEGTKKILTILFTDIRGFTFMTETLGNDIIKLLNLHYDKAIRHIQDKDGIVGSIIGDALLAVYGTLDGAYEKKSLKALQSAYLIQDVASDLRAAMRAKKDSILQNRGELTPMEEDIYKAVLLEVGVGIDGGEVFYGNIGSYERMTNTVIGDNVNSSSRLEGLTRVYQVPVITSGFVKNEVEADSGDYWFVELDTVQVKGKTEGKKVYWPVERKSLTPELKEQLLGHIEGLEAYYRGDWPTAEKLMSKVGLELSQVFLERIGGRAAPSNWNGIWAMTSK